MKFFIGTQMRWIPDPPRGKRTKTKQLSLLSELLPYLKLD